MKAQFVKTFFIFTGFLFLLFVCYTLVLESSVGKEDTENVTVLLNEIEQLTTRGGSNPAKAQIGRLQEEIKQVSAIEQKRDVKKTGAVYAGVTFIYAAVLFLYLYFKLIRPFWRLEDYAQNIAKGDLSVELKQERTNFFGAFTWAFDHMREELLFAKKNEEQAIRENKTIIAALSHDIKTPIASIRAYAEGLEANLSADYEARERYLQVIMKKCDEVTKLTNDLVLHSLSELEHLEVKEQRIEIGEVLETIISDLEDSHITLTKPVPQAEVMADEKRMAQVIENLLNNAKKYAPESAVEVWAAVSEDCYEIHIRDHGEGILPEDMPFIFEKFYRGKNVGDKPGSGLGLYIVKYIMERMKGTVELLNHNDGLEVILNYDIVKESREIINKAI